MQMVSLKTMQHSFFRTVPRRIGVVNRAAVDWFVGELRVGHLFEELRSFLLLEDGQFGQSLGDQLFEKVRVCVCVCEWCGVVWASVYVNCACFSCVKNNKLEKFW